MNLSDLRKPCVHGYYDWHGRRLILGEPECPGGSSVTTEDMLDALVEEGVLEPFENNPDYYRRMFIEEPDAFR